jgi:hypothetical protein
MAGLFQTLRGSEQGLHVDKLLDNMLKSRGVPRDFIYNKAFYGVSVSKMTDLIAKINPENDLRLYEARPQGIDGLMERVSFNVAAPLSYELQVFGLESLISNISATASDPIFDFVERQGRYPIDRLRFRLEYAATVQTLRNASVMTQNTTLAAAQKWSNRGSPDSNPIDDLLTWVRYVREQSMREISMIVMAAPVWQEIVQHPTTQNRADVTTWRNLTPETLEKLLDVPAGTVYVDKTGLYQAPGTTANTGKRYFMGPDVVILASGPASRADYSFGHMYYLGGAAEDPIVTMRYPEYRVARGGEVVQTSALVHFLVEAAEAAFVAFSVVDPTLARFNNALGT